MSLRTRFARLRQKHGVSIGVFKQEYDELKATLIGAGVPAMPDAEDAMEFLSKLDMVRYGEMFSFLTNRAHLGESFPATLHDAWQVASKCTVSGPVGGKIDASGELLSIFALADERSPPLRPGRGGGGGILLDNQAGRSVFRNARLLTDTRRLERPICIGGVDGSSKGIRVETDGDFEDLGRVGICGHAAANILSKAEMVDAGHRISYVNDEYHLDGDGVAMVFRRKLLGDGKHKSKHYSCEMADAASAATLPVTVEESWLPSAKRTMTSTTSP
jgi:hypothetical protein